MKINLETETEHHCKLVEWDSVSVLGCTPTRENVKETDFNIEEHDRRVRKRTG